MTKEEINKKAEKHCNEVLCNAHEKCNEFIKCRDWRSRRAGFFCGYEQALKDFEKENAELERKLEQIEKDLADYQFNYPTIKELQKEIAELKAKIYGGGYDAVIAKKDADIILLEKQNSELKKQIEKMKCCGNCNGILYGGRRTEKCHRCMDSKELSEWELAND